MRPKRSCVRLTETDIVNEQQIHYVYNELNKMRYIQDILPQKDIISLLHYILKKHFRNNEELFILNAYLRIMEKFILIIKEADSSEDNLNTILNKITKAIQCQKVEKQTMLFRIGDKGKSFYIVLKGSVSVLLPKKYIETITREDYINHLGLLYMIDEKELVKKTIKSNLTLIKYDESDIIKDIRNKTMKIINPKTFSCISAEKYLESLQIQEKKSSRIKIKYKFKLWTYYEVTVLNEGSSFGELALLSKQSKRTASIYVNAEDTYFGTLNEEIFNDTIKIIQMQAKEENTLSVYTYHIFDKIPFDYFVEKYWNSFIYKQLIQGDDLFVENKPRTMIYFLKEGELEISAKLNMSRIDTIIEGLGGKRKMQYVPHYDIDYDLMKDHKISIIKNRDILGLEDCLYDNKFFCNVTCISKKAKLFGIDTKYLKGLKKSNGGLLEQFDFLQKSKKLLMIDRLNLLKNMHTYQQTKTPLSSIKAKLLPLFTSRNNHKSPKKHTLFMNLQCSKISDTKKQYLMTTLNNSDRYNNTDYNSQSLIETKERIQTAKVKRTYLTKTTESKPSPSYRLFSSTARSLSPTKDFSVKSDRDSKDNVKGKWSLILKRNLSKDLSSYRNSEQRKVTNQAIKSIGLLASYSKSKKDNKMNDSNIPNITYRSNITKERISFVDFLVMDRTLEKSLEKNSHRNISKQVNDKKNKNDYASKIIQSFRHLSYVPLNYLPNQKPRHIKMKQSCLNFRDIQQKDKFI